MITLEISQNRASVGHSQDAAIRHQQTTDKGQQRSPHNGAQISLHTHTNTYIAGSSHPPHPPPPPPPTINPVIISIVHRIREFSSLSLTTDVDQPRASKVNEDKSAKIKALRKERKSVRPSCGERSIAEVVWRPGYGCRTGCVSSRPKESSKTGVNESLRGERERERERERWCGARGERMDSDLLSYRRSTQRRQVL